MELTSGGELILAGGTGIPSISVPLREIDLPEAERARIRVAAESCDHRPPAEALTHRESSREGPTNKGWAHYSTMRNEYILPI